MRRELGRNAEVRGNAQKAIAAVIACGVALTLLAAAVWSMPSADVAELVVLAAGTAGVGALGTAVLLRLVRSKPFAVQIATAAVATLMPVVIGVWAGSRAMILDGHDVGALTVVLLAAGTVAIVTAVVLGHRLGRASDGLVDAARRMGEATPGFVVLGDSVPEELTRVHHELELTSARLDAARTRERALEQSRRELVAWVSHDLRTPLAGIKVLAEALEDGVADDPATVTRYHHSLGVEVDRLSGLVDDLFELSRAQAGVLRLDFEPVSLGDLVSDAIASAAPAAEAKRVHLEGHLATEPRELRASSPEVLRALRNILENAIRHTPADGTVTVEAGVEADRAYVSVADNGGGIHEAEMARIFDVAFRGDTARTPGDGAGLGLAIARGLIEAHHGEITVCNDNGGARFTIRLPLEPVVAD